MRRNRQAAQNSYRQDSLKNPCEGKGRGGEAGSGTQNMLSEPGAVRLSTHGVREG